MKKSHSFNKLFTCLIVLCLLLSCSSDEGSEDEGIATPNSITLQSNLSSGSPGLFETISFTVKGNDGRDYTDKSIIYLNGEALNGKSYKFTENGEHSFVAKMNNISSNAISITIEHPAAAQPESITLSSSEESSRVSIDETVKFRVLGDNNVDYTSQSEIKINGESIEGNQYTFTEGGDHLITATYEDLNSNTLEMQVATINYITLNNQKVLRGQEVIFEFFGPDGAKATENATFFVNGNPISSNTYSSQTTGNYTVTAKMGSGEETEGKDFEIFIPVRKALFEDYTGTWCGWCPRVTNAILKLKEKTDNLVVVAVHFQDEMMIEASKTLVSHFQIEFFPHARLNRTTIVEFPEDSESEINRVLQIAGTDSPFSIAINTTLNNDLLDIEVKLISEVAIPEKSKLVVYLLQNGVVFPQINYLNNDSESRWYQQGDPIKTFVHDEVLQASLTDIFGDPINAIPAYEEASFDFKNIDLSEFTYAEPGNIYNPNKFEVVAILSTADNTALNAQKVTAGHNVDFE